MTTSQPTGDARGSGSIQWRDKSWRSKRETSAYLYERCNGWHLISKGRRKR